MKRKVELLLMAMALIVFGPLFFFTRNNNKMCITCGTDCTASNR